MTKKPAPPPVPEEKRYAPSDEMAQIMFDAVVRQYAPLLTVDEIRRLTEPERRQLWLQRHEEMRRAEALKAAEVVDKGGGPPRLPRGAGVEIRRRIGRGEVKIAGAMAKKYPDVMKPRSWQRWVKRFRDAEIAKTTKPTD